MQVRSHRERWQRLLLLAGGWIVLLFSIASFLVAEDMRTSFSSDIYYLPMLLKDLTQMGGSLAEWRLPPAPYFFPDLPVYAFARAITGHAIPALVLSGVMHYLLFTGGWMALITRFSVSRSSKLKAQVLLLIIASLAVSLGAFRYIAFWSTQITMHFGVIAVMPWFLLLLDVTTTARRARSRYAAAAGLLVMSALLAASDMLSVTQLLMPAVFTAIFLYLLARIGLRAAVLPSVSILAGGIIGANLLRWVGKASLTGYIRPDLLHSSNATRAFIFWIESLIKYQPAGAILTLALLTTDILLALFFIGKSARAKEVNARALMLTCFVPLAIVFNVVAVLIMGNFFSSADARYALSLMFYPLFSFPVLAAMVKIPSVESRRATVMIATVALLAIVSLNLGFLPKLGELNRYSSYCPAWIGWLDQQADELDLKDGVSSYWDAKEAMLLSKHDLRLVQSTPYMVPYNWISNTKWYDRCTPTFFICSTNPKRTDCPQEKEVITTFGQPDERRAFEDRSILVYNSPESLLKEWYRGHPMRQEFGNVGDRALFPASQLPGDAGSDNGPERTAREGVDRAGSLTLGPYIMMPHGTYRAEIRYKAQPGPDYVSSGYWQLRTVERNQPKLMREEALDPGSNIATLEFDLKGRSSVELLTSFTGSGVLTVESILFQRVR